MQLVCLRAVCERWNVLCDCIVLSVCVWIPGGLPGAKGRNLLMRKNGDVLDLGGKKAVDAVPGVREAKLFSSFGRSIASLLVKQKSCTVLTEIFV